MPFLGRMCKLVIVAIFAWAIVVSAAADSSGGERDPDVVLELFHVNGAWGYVAKGLYVDSNGNLYSFDVPEELRGRVWAASLGERTLSAYFSKVRLFRRLETRRKLLRPLSDEEFRRVTTSVATAKGVRLEVPRGCGADGGRNMLVAYEPIQESDFYLATLLYEDGDTCIDSPVEGVAELSAWLQNILWGITQ